MHNVIIDGVRYIPEGTVTEPKADRLSFWYMHDCHLFTKLKGRTLTEVVQHATEIRNESTWGMLCPVTVLAGQKELRRIGPSIHCHGREKDLEWAEGCRKWVEELSKDVDVVRLLGEQE